MTNRKETKMNTNSKWILAKAEKEANSSVSVGGLLTKLGREQGSREKLFQVAKRLFPRLNEVGIPKEFVKKRLLPPGLSERPNKIESGIVDEYILEVANRIYGWSPEDILGQEVLQLNNSVLGSARFKVRAKANKKKLSAYTIYAHYLALQLLEATANLSQKPIPTDVLTVRSDILTQYGSVTFEHALHYAWNLGVPVLPLNDPGAFHGACWRVNGRNVIVLKQKTGSVARWLHDLLHELRHAAENPQEKEHTVIEAEETSDERRESEEELEAMVFAFDVVLDGRANSLAKMCEKETRGRQELLKKVVSQIAAREGVPEDTLANYMAFRIWLDDGDSWWGAASNLQQTDRNPWKVAKDLLFEKTDFSRLLEMDKNLLKQALSNE